VENIVLLLHYKEEIAQDKCLENRTCPGFNTHIILRPAQEGKIMGETSGFAMVKRKSRDVFPYLGDQLGKYIKNRFKRENGRIYSSRHVVRNFVHIDIALLAITTPVT